MLSEQVENIDARLAVLEQMKELALCARDGLRRKQVDDFGELLHQGWLMKRQLASRISNPAIDASYDAARGRRFGRQDYRSRRRWLFVALLPG